MWHFLPLLSWPVRDRNEQAVLVCTVGSVCEGPGMEWEVFGGKSEQRGKDLGCRGDVCGVFLQGLVSFWLQAVRLQESGVHPGVDFQQVAPVMPSNVLRTKRKLRNEALTESLWCTVRVLHWLSWSRIARFSRRRAYRDWGGSSSEEHKWWRCLWAPCVAKAGFSPLRMRMGAWAQQGPSAAFLHLKLLFFVAELSSSVPGCNKLLSSCISSITTAFSFGRHLVDMLSSTVVVAQYINFHFPSPWTPFSFTTAPRPPAPLAPRKSGWLQLSDPRLWQTWEL